MTPTPDAPAVHVTVVHAPACHFCDDATRVLAELGETWPLVVRVVELESAEGARLVVRHRPAMSPLVLVEGEYFSSGRLPRKKLLKLLAGRTAAASARSVVSA